VFLSIAVSINARLDKNTGTLMKTFIYHDEKSHKFWTIEQQGHELHLSWGKVGTNGQSQIKTFADAAAASKTEVKLINEKIRKGYVEDTHTERPALPASPSAAPQPEYALTPADITRPWLADDGELLLSDELLEKQAHHDEKRRRITVCLHF
jgi:predicted DNA-binding WGR domain protein